MNRWSAVVPALRGLARDALRRLASGSSRADGEPGRGTAPSRGLTSGRRDGAHCAGRSGSAATRRSPGRTPHGSSTGTAYPGDVHGPVRVEYAPVDDGFADPGEVVWAWVPYEEDHARGKDRPVLVIGRDGPWLLALPLTSKDHDRDAAQEARAGRHWVDVGTGAWDPRGRPSEARVDRVVRVDPAAVRRVGARLDRARFDIVAALVRTR